MGIQAVAVLAYQILEDRPSVRVWR